ncbi:MAG: M23 family metallopeptidase [Myxococcales bacterium]|nr:M23 family metallopeptidase [Myxococcales bacterium]MCB9734486.1 M23 family metallopeptidase [Deltaproteobacteria bacterium]
MNPTRLPLADVLGLRPLGPTLAQAALVFRGDPHLPPSRFGTSSLNLFTPRLAVRTWLGQRVAGRTLVVTNLYNHAPTPIAEGWSVRVTHVRDFRGGQLTYDTHNGVDFACPPGTVTVAAAPGRVVAIRREFDRGGLKVYLDHGDGLMTSHHHLAKALVAVGDEVARGEPVALTGYSGLDAVTTFPWVAPHVHYNTYLGGVLVDPFAAAAGEAALWRGGNDPRPTPAGPADRAHTPVAWDPARVEAVLASLRDPARRAAIAAIPDLDRRAVELVIEACTYPTRFGRKDAAAELFPEAPARAPRLDLPFTAEDYDGVGFADALGYRRARERAAAISSGAAA